MKIERFDIQKTDEWDTFVLTCEASTFLHTRKYLSYHKARFQDASLLIRNDGGKLLAVFPAAVSVENERCISSHPGLTYGGFVFSTAAARSQVAIREIMCSAFSWYKQQEYTSLVYKAQPSHLNSNFLASDQYELWVRRSEVYRRDLWNVLRLDDSRKANHGHLRNVTVAHKAKLVAREENTERAYSLFHAILSERLAEKYQRSPVHSVSEMMDLYARFPDRISLWIVEDAAANIVAGTWVYKISPHTWHAQYIAANDAGRHLRATDFLLEEVITDAKRAMVAYFSLGASTQDEGKTLNASLFDFKAGFGIGSLVQDFYHITL